MVKVRSLCSRGSANIVEEGVPDSDLVVLHVRVGSGLFSRSARNSSHFFWRASSDSLRVVAQASRYSALLSVIVQRRAFRFLIAFRSFGVDQGVSTCLRLFHMELYRCEKSRVEAMDHVAEWHRSSFDGGEE